jgi:hypothetical protein
MTMLDKAWQGKKRGQATGFVMPHNPVKVFMLQGI